MFSIKRNTNRHFLALLWFIQLSGVLFSQTDFYTLSGIIYDEESSVEIKGAAIRIPKFVKSFKTDALGQFSFTLPEGKYSIVVEKEDYEPRQFEIHLKSDTMLTIPLKSLYKVSIIEDVVVVANQKIAINRSIPGLTRLAQVDVQNLPALGGEKDIVKGLQTLPGVQQSYEGSASLVVRGGTPDQNLYLLDNVRIYNTNHAFGLISTYNPNIIKTIDFYRGGFPANYGGFISSVLDVKTKDEIKDSLDGSIDLGIISGSVFLSSPLMKHGSIILASRRTFIDLLSKISADANEIIPYSFSDYAAKLMFNRNNRKLSIGFFKSFDNISFRKSRTGNTSVESKSESIWGTEMLNASYQYSINKNLNNEFQIYYTSYRLSSEEEYKTKDSDLDFRGSINSILASVGATNSLHMIILDSLEILAGADFMHHIFNPAFLKGNSSNVNFVHYYIPKSYLNETGIFVESVIKLPLNIIFRPGIRYDTYQTNKKTYNYALLRSALQLMVFRNHYLKLAFSQTAQPIHLVSNVGLGPPVDIWLPASEILTPQKANQYTLGYYFTLKSYTVTFEYFEKYMRNIVTYLDGHGSFDIIKSYTDKSEIWTEAFTQGYGHANGFELFIEKTRGIYTGWVSYTLSWSKNVFEKLNNNEEFWSPYDRRHVINIAGSIQLSKDWKISLNWQYMSGQPITMPKYYYIVENNRLINNQNYIYADPVLVWGYGKRNSERMKAVHHLDLCIRRNISSGKFIGNVEIGLYNLYNRKNPYYYYGKYDGKVSIKSVSLFPIIPYFSVRWYPFRKSL